MAVEDDMTKWRTIYCADPTRCKVTTYPNAGTAHTVVQSDPTKLLCTTTPSAITAQKVIQSDQALLKVTNTPDGETIQPISQGAAIQGIWPAEGSTRVNASDYQSGIGTTIIYTVPAGKKLFLASVLTTVRSIANGYYIGYIGVRDHNDAFQYWVHVSYFIIIGQVTEPQNFRPALEAGPSFDVYAYTNDANITVRGTIHGWLENA